jgi:predicted nucleic acid-binding protein
VIPVIDGLLAATALENDLTLVTRDISHRELAGVELFNPREE